MRGVRGSALEAPQEAESPRTEGPTREELLPWQACPTPRLNTAPNWPRWLQLAALRICARRDDACRTPSMPDTLLVVALDAGLRTPALTFQALLAKVDLGVRRSCTCAHTSVSGGATQHVTLMSHKIAIACGRSAGSVTVSA